MIEISLGKMVLLALIALIVLGPEKLPGAARTAGALLRRVRSGWDNVRAEVERELEIEEIKRTAREAAAQAEAAQNAMKDTLQQAHEPLADAAAMIKDVSSKDAVVKVESPAALSAEVAHDITPDEQTSQMQAELPLGEPAATPHTREASHGGA
jgi:sec-independent protein translocase protein TatB